jgi:hypothetical protein
MGNAIPGQQPTVVLRSHFTRLRALLAVATVALVGLTAAVVILATEDEVATSTRSVNPLSALTPKERHRVEALSSLWSAQLGAPFGPGTVPARPPGRPYGSDPGILGPSPTTRYDGDPGILGPSPSTRYDGDPGILGPSPSTRYDGDWHFSPAPPRAASAAEMKDGAVTATRIGQAGDGIEFRGSKASEHGTSAGQPMSGARP